MKWKRMHRGFLPVSVLLIGIWLFSSAAGQAAQPSNSCATCHLSLSASLPKGHPPVSKGTLLDCLSCHSEKAVRPGTLEWSAHYRHFAVVNFTGTCWACHQIGSSGYFHLVGIEERGVKVSKESVDKMSPFFKLWSTSKFMDHTHAAMKVSCGDCHGSFFPEERASDENCLKCHKSHQHVAQLTKNVKPNPHDSHLGELRCTICHKAHEKSVYYCNHCHTFDDRMSKGKK